MIFLGHLEVPWKKNIERKYNINNSEEVKIENNGLHMLMDNVKEGSSTKSSSIAT